jgi:alkylation response protein AidB-like acyl-CoA dehydrogenase
VKRQGAGLAAAVPKVADFVTKVHDFFDQNASRRRRLSGEELDAETPRRALSQAGPSSDETDDLNRIARAKDFQAKLVDAGLAALTWPTAYGGQGLPVMYEQLFLEVAAEYVSPLGTFFIGHGMCMPTILTHGTEAQRLRYVPPAIRGDEVWCQLFSEPGAGSDVASLRSRAIQDGGDWILTGQKVWTTGAHYSDFGIVIARTDPTLPKHDGITMFILDMRAPGVTVRPLRQITGGSEFNEVFFDEVRVPGANALGAANNGWRVSRTTLMNERISVGTGARRMAPREPGSTPIDSYIRLARERHLAEDALTRQRLADMYVQHRIQEMTGERIRSKVKAGITPGPEGSTAKLFAAQLEQRAAEVAAEMAGVGAIAWSMIDSRMVALARWGQLSVASRAISIAGGTNEIQRNIIGERFLGLPREPSTDKTVPFEDTLASERQPTLVHRL